MCCKIIFHKDDAVKALQCRVSYATCSYALRIDPCSIQQLVQPEKGFDGHQDAGDGPVVH